MWTRVFDSTQWVLVLLHRVFHYWVVSNSNYLFHFSFYHIHFGTPRSSLSIWMSSRLYRLPITLLPGPQMPRSRDKWWLLGLYGILLVKVKEFFQIKHLFEKHKKNNVELLYNECVFNCPPGDFDCFGVCSREYQAYLETCPCQSGCPQGCPCPEYQCPSESTTTQTVTTTVATINMAMLFLSTYIPGNWFNFEFWYKGFSLKNHNKNQTESNPPRLIETAGELSTSFKTSGQEVYDSCGVTFQNKQYIFGGNTNKRQVLQIEDCGLIRIGTTEFDHVRGACGSTNTMIVLCFNSFDAKRCRQASSPTGRWTQMQLSTYHHRFTSIAISQGNQ